MPDRDDVERLLDAALSTYGDPGPHSGLEARVQSRVHAEFAARRRRWQLLWAGVLAAGSACGLLLFAPWRSVPPHTAPRIEGRIERPSVSAPAAPGAAGLRRHAAPHERIASVRSAGRGTTPKLDVFPDPAPLTVQEQALVHFAAQTQEAQYKELMAAGADPDAPIDIAAISIPPIEPPSRGKE